MSKINSRQDSRDTSQDRHGHSSRCHSSGGHKSSGGHRAFHSVGHKRSRKYWACGVTPLADKLVHQNCFRDYAADRESEGQQVSDLLKKVVKDSIAELMASRPSQQAPQHAENEGAIYGRNYLTSSRFTHKNPSGPRSFRGFF